MYFYWLLLVFSIILFKKLRFLNQFSSVYTIGFICDSLGLTCIYIIELSIGLKLFDIIELSRVLKCEFLAPYSDY